METAEKPGAASTASVEIFEPITSGVGRHAYVLTLRDESGQPIAGAEVSVRMEGSGSLQPTFSSYELRRETDQSGTARFTWYRRSIYGRDVRATVTVSIDRPGCQVAIEETEPEYPGTSYDISGKSKWKFKIGSLAERI